MTATLSYDFWSINPHDTFDRAEAWNGNLGAWSCTLDHGKLTATTAEAFESETDARASLEPMLRAWEASAYLRDQYEIRFVPEGTPDDAARADSPQAHDQIFRRVNETYPAPDPDFSMTALVEQLMGTVHRFTETPAELPLVIADLLTRLDTSLGEIGAASVDAAYNIEPDVLGTLGELSDPARQAAAGGRPAYRGPEWQWMQEAQRLVTLQAGRRSTAPPTTRLTMADFKSQL